jgi:hypothetical protein
VDWLIKQGVILGGIPIQNWMLLALAVIAVGIVVAWWSNR